MSVISRLIVVHSDPRVAEAVRYGFEREGADVVSARPEALGAAFGAEPPQLVVAGGSTADDGQAILQGVRGGLAAVAAPVPVLYLGNGISRSQALAAGASEVLPQPAFLRDVVTVGTMLASPRPGAGGSAGDLGDYFGLFYMIRALGAVRRNGVLTLVRGLRRGELRFFDGEVTSAQVGVLHGLAALHQLLLWTEARFEFRNEPVVRRQQIPMNPTELLADAERFLAEIHTECASLSPSMVFEQDSGRAADAALPPPVAAVLALFDGHRTVADVIEDSPYRVFETLRVAQRLAELRVVTRVATSKPRSAARAALAIEEWLVGDSKAAIPVHATARESEPIGPLPGQPASPPRQGKKNKRKRKKSKQAAAATPAPMIDGAVVATDWTGIMPATVSASEGGLSPVVPSSMASGEIDISSLARAAAEPGESRPQESRSNIEIDFGDPQAPASPPAEVEPAPVGDGSVRERLEELTNTEQRKQIFPVEQVPETAGARATVADEAAQAAEVEAAREAEVTALREAQAVARKVISASAQDDEWARARAEAEARAAEEAAEKAAVAAAAAADAEAKAAALAKAAAAAKADAEAAAKARAEAEAKAAEEARAAAAARAAAEAEAAAKAEAEAAAAEAKAKAEAEAAAKAEAEAAAAEAKAKAEAEAEAAAAEEAKAEAEAERAGASASGAIDRAADGQDTSGEIAVSPGRPEAMDIADSGPSIIIADAASIAAAAGRVAPSPKTSPDATHADSAVRATQVAAAASGIGFTDDEEAFFSAGKQLEKAPMPKIESFEDLDEGYQPRTFWERLTNKSADKGAAPAEPSPRPGPAKPRTSKRKR